MDENYTRRSVLRTGAAASSVAALGGLAGCSSVPFVGGGGASFSQWLYAPDAIGDSEHYFFNYTDDQTVRNNEDNFDSDFFDRQESSEDDWPLSQMDVDYDEVTNSLGLGTGGVINGSFNKEDVVDALDDNDFDDEDDDYSGYAIYQKNDQRAVGVTGGQAVYTQAGFSGGDVEVVDAVEAIIDTSNGEEDRYADENEDMQALLNQIGGGTFAFGRTQEEADETNTDRSQFEGQVGFGVDATVNGETTSFTYALVFDDADGAEDADIEDWADDSENFEDIDDVSVNQNGRTVVVSGQGDTDEYGV